MWLAISSFFGPHQIDVAMLGAQLQRVGRIAAEIQQRAAILLIGLCRRGRQTPWN
jgi:hypothetical protein